MVNETKYRRRDGIAWREEPEATREVRAALEGGTTALEGGRDAEREGTMLLVERGRVHEINILAADIWKLLDGSRDAAAIAEELLRAGYDVGREELEADVRGFIATAAANGWVVPA